MKQFYSIILVVLIAINFSCERDFSFRGGDEGLWFSNDTISFDTIFTSLGSITKSFRVYNKYDEDLTINRISLAGGEDSNYRININGLPQTDVQEIKIRSHDSLYVFVEITIDPGGVDVPFVVKDSIVFETLKTIQYIPLIAYGQDVVIIDSEILDTQTFTSEKPYLIFDYAVVDTFKHLTIEPGARIYFHNDASLLVFGGIDATGTVDEPIIFQGDRLDDYYDNIPGQWGFIHFYPNSRNNVLDHVIIKNGAVGVRIDSVGLGDDPPMIISNTVIQHISHVGLLVENSKLKVTNSLFGDCGTHSVALTCGGSYEFYHCTLARMYTYGIANYSYCKALYIDNYYNDNNGNEVIIPLEQAVFGNSVIYGVSNKEIFLDLKEIKEDGVDPGVNYYFDHCYIKNGGTVDVSDTDHFNGIIEDEDPGFVLWGTRNLYDYNVELDTLSLLRDAGAIEYANVVPIDLIGVDRLKDTMPDIGVYERVEE